MVKFLVGHYRKLHKNGQWPAAILSFAWVVPDSVLITRFIADVISFSLQCHGRAITNWSARRHVLTNNRG